jgi:methionyl-tRNA formyltransferase
MASPSGLRIVFFGTPEFAAYILRYLAGQGEQILAVVTIPDKPQGRGLKTRSSAVKETAEELGLPVLTPAKHRDPAFIDALKQFGADVYVVVAYKILPPEVFTLPQLGAFNVHASLLPKYRGAAPINWSIIRGEQETGITTFLLDEHVDTGKMLLAKRTVIGPNETAGELHDKLMVIGAEAAEETLRGLRSGNLKPISQPEGEGTTAPKIYPQDCIIDFHQSAEDTHNFIRGLSPHPGAVTTLATGTKLKILRSKIPPDHFQNSNVGELFNDGKRLFVGTESGALELLELQREGKRAMSAEEFLRGWRP